jgi:phosphoenolpyruvate carboxykinase (ATP)
LAHYGFIGGPHVLNAKVGHDGKHDAYAEVLSKPQTDAGLKPTCVFHNLSVAELYEKALAHEPGTHIVSSGALATLSGAKTGRSPKDKRIVREPESEGDVWWGPGSPNFEMDEKTFLINRGRAIDYLNTLDRVYVFDGFVNWDTEYRYKVRVITARAYHALFMYNMLIRPSAEELASFGDPDFVIYNAGAFPCNRYSEYMTSSTSVNLSFKHMEMVILGTQYAGCMKKGIFTLMNYLLPKRGVLSLHSGCNIGPRGDVTMFFGLSGTGKTTLSADPHRPLIGDDEHGWSDGGVFNLEGGCYAKAINLDPRAEPDIFNAIRFGTVLENVVFDPNSHEVDFRDSGITENTRASYPIQYISNALIPCVGPHPRNIIMLTCDAFGVLPPVSRLTPEQAMYHFVSGYTAKVAGTEMGVTEPEATFSACFGSAFIVWHPMKYAGMLAEKMKRHGATAWLVNTGWTGGKYGVGSRMSLKHTRAIIDAIHTGDLARASYVSTEVFKLRVPTVCRGVPPGVLQPHQSWVDQGEFRATLAHLADLFQANFEKFADGAGLVSAELAATIVAAGPQQEQ